MPTAAPQDPAGEPFLVRSESPANNSTPTPKPQTEVVDRRVSPSPVRRAPKLPLHHYYLRAVVAIFVPAAVTAYYGVIWFHLVQGSPYDETVKYRNFNGSLVFYSWFIIGVFVLSWSKYGLIGVEAAMIFTSRRWVPPNLVALLMHADNTWNSPSGWWKAIYHCGKSSWESINSHSEQQKATKDTRLWRLWILLAVTSLLPFVAIPLSGLVFELGDGYVPPLTTKPVLVQGRNSTTFNSRYDRGALTLAAPWRHAWLVGAAPVIPGLGVIYTNANASVDRSTHPSFNKLPNTLPSTESIPDLFLVPQADAPVSGKTWGLRIKYDCSIVRSTSEFTILSQKQRSSPSSPSQLPRDCGDYCYGLTTPSEDDISLMNSSDPLAVSNVQAYYEVGRRLWRLGKYSGKHPDFESDEGNTSTVIEFAAWQYRTTHQTFDDLKFPFNKTVGPYIEDVGGPFTKLANDSYAINETFFVLDEVPSNGSTADPSRLVGYYRVYNEYYRVVDVAPPIGVRCVVSSGLGTATLSGVTSTFNDYVRLDPLVDPVYEYGPQRFGSSALSILHDQPWFQHYIAGGLTGTQPDQNGNRFPQFIDSMSLLRSVNLAFAQDAFDLMYGVTSGFRGQWPEPGLTSSTEGKILVVASLVRGRVLGDLVLGLLALWAAISLVLATVYGFRRRPADVVDGYVMLREGADLADELQANEDFTAGKPYYQSRTLTGLRVS